MKFPEVRMWKWIVAVTIIVPWLNPLAAGPTPSVIPWLVSLYSVCVLLLLAAMPVHVAPRTGARFERGAWIAPVASAWAVAGVVSCMIGLVQYFGASASFSPWISQAELGEAYGNLRQRNQFATLANMALACLVWLALTRPASRAEKWALFLAASLLATGNAISSSRGGLAQYIFLCMACGVWGACRKPLVRQLLLVAGATYLLAAIALPWLAGLDTETHGMLARVRDGASCASRLTLWSNVIHLIAQKPWTGWGWGELDYAHYMTLYEGPRFCELLDNAHNLPLHLAVELGIPASLLICGAVVGWVALQRPWREKSPSRQLAWVVLMMIILHSLVEYPLWYGPFQIAACVCILFLGLRSPEKFPGDAMEGDKPAGYWLRLALLAGAVALFIAATFAFCDYRRISQIYLAPTQRLPAYRDSTLEKIKGSWLFAGQVSFAELSLTPLTRDNADWTFRTAEALLHFSPEPKVIERLIESATMSEREGEAVAHLARYRAAYPKEYADWSRANAAAPPLPVAEEQ